MNKLQKATIALRRQLDKLESLVEQTKGTSGKNSRRRIARSKVHSASARKRRRK